MGVDVRAAAKGSAAYRAILAKMASDTVKANAALKGLAGGTTGVAAAQRTATKTTKAASQSVGGWNAAMRAGIFASQGFTNSAITAIAGFSGIGAAALIASIGVVKFSSASIKSFGEFEEALGRVQRVMGTTDEEAQELGEAFLDMSTKIPVAATELANIGQEVARLGIRGTKNVSEFTKTVALLSTVSDLTGTIAATSLGRIIAISDIGPESVGNFASALREVATTVAAGEAEILRMTLELTKAGAAFGLTANKALALAATLKDIGVAPELTRSAFLRLFGSLEKALGGSTDQLIAWKELLSLSALELNNLSADEFVDRAAAAFANAIKNGDNLIVLMEKLGLESVRNLTVFGSLGKQGEKLAQAQNTVNKAYVEGTRLLIDAEGRVEELTARQALLSAEWFKTKTLVGQQLAPAMIDLVDTLVQLNVSFRESEGGISTFVTVGNTGLGLMRSMANRAVELTDVINDLGLSFLALWPQIKLGLGIGNTAALTAELEAILDRTSGAVRDRADDFSSEAFSVFRSLTSGIEGLDTQKAFTAVFGDFRQELRRLPGTAMEALDLVREAVENQPGGDPRGILEAIFGKDILPALKQAGSDPAIVAGVTKTAEQMAKDFSDGFESFLKDKAHLSLEPLTSGLAAQIQKARNIAEAQSKASLEKGLSGANLETLNRLIENTFGERIQDQIAEFNNTIAEGKVDVFELNQRYMALVATLTQAGGRFDDLIPSLTGAKEKLEAFLSSFEGRFQKGIEALASRASSKPGILGDLEDIEVLLEKQKEFQGIKIDFEDESLVRGNADLLEFRERTRAAFTGQATLEIKEFFDALEDGSIDLEDLNEKTLNTLLAIDKMGPAFEQSAVGIMRASEEYKRLQELLENPSIAEGVDIATSSVKDFTTTLANGLLEGELNFDNFAKSFVANLLEMIFRLQVILPLIESLGGGSGGIGGFFNLLGQSIAGVPLGGVPAGGGPGAGLGGSTPVTPGLNIPLSRQSIGDPSESLGQDIADMLLRVLPTGRESDRGLQDGTPVLLNLNDGAIKPLGSDIADVLSPIIRANTEPNGGLQDKTPVTPGFKGDPFKSLGRNIADVLLGSMPKGGGFGGGLGGSTPVMSGLKSPFSRQGIGGGITTNVTINGAENGKRANATTRSKQGVGGMELDIVVDMVDAEMAKRTTNGRSQNSNAILSRAKTTGLS